MSEFIVDDRRSTKKRAAILRAATEGFLAKGYVSTSIDEVAAAAGVGKQTIYSHFRDKETLFLAAISASRKMLPPVADPREPNVKDPEGGLVRLALRILDIVMDPTVAALHRLTISELPRHPELQDIWRESTAPDASFAAVHEFLVGCQDARTLEVRDPQRTARQFALLLAVEARTATAQATRPLSRSERDRIAKQTVDLFTRALRIDKET